MTADKIWSFTTGTRWMRLPAIAATDPLDAATGVADDEQIRVLHEAMDLSTLNTTVHCLDWRN
jgi:hypothetical protein